MACKLNNDFVEFLDGNSISGSEGIADHFVAKWRWSGKLGELAKRFWWKTIKSSLLKSLPEGEKNGWACVTRRKILLKPSAGAGLDVNSEKPFMSCLVAPNRVSIDI